MRSSVCVNRHLTVLLFSPIIILTLSILFTFINSSSAAAIRCFCDRWKCESTICQSNWCQIGFKNARLIQSCANDVEGPEAKKCRRHWNGWEEVCACNSTYCNTFIFLRVMIRRHEPESEDEREAAVKAVELRDSIEQTALAPHSRERLDLAGQSAIGSVDSLPPSSDGSSYQRNFGGNGRSRNPADYVGTFDSNQLIALVVMIPLAVGTLAVCFVFVNYQCRMC